MVKKPILIRKQKQVVRDLEQIKLPTENQFILKTIREVGNNLLKVVTPTGEECLASIPTKYRNFLYALPDTFLLCEPIPEGKKVKFEVAYILYAEQQRYFMENNVWPEQFLDNKDVRNIHDKVQKQRNESEKPSTPVDDDSVSDNDDNMCGFRKFDPTQTLRSCPFEDSASETSEESDDNDTPKKN